MSTQYHIYANDLAGGPVDYTTIIATVAGLSLDLPGPGPNTDATYAIRAFDTVSGLEERNVDARVRIVSDALGRDVSGRPMAPVGLTADARAAGAIRVTWTQGAGNAPTGFRVYAGTPTISYGSPLATVTADGRRSYSAVLPGLTDGASYQVGVRAFNATGEEPNTITVSVTADATGPLPVANLTAVATSTT